MREPFESAAFSTIRTAVRPAKALLVTATDVETAAVHRLVKPLPGRSKILKVHEGNLTYFVGALGHYGVIHVQCEMGSIGAGSSATAVMEAIGKWKPNAIIMVGIAFGTKPYAQQIGDVLLSKSVIPYEIRRVGKRCTLYRSVRPPAGATLFNRFRHHADWRFSLGRRKHAQVIPCDLLSGEALIDNKGFRDSLRKEFPTAEGGEMEGAGVYAAAHQAQIQWVLIKAICDYADGKKNENKRERQKLAAASAASLCHHVLSTPNALGHLRCKMLTEYAIPAGTLGSDGAFPPDGATPAPPPDHGAILFDVYRPELERFYPHRDTDGDIQGIVKSNSSIWLHGPAGSGKTNAILRNLSILKKTYLFVDLSSSVNTTTPQIFQTLVDKVADQLTRMEAPTRARTQTLASSIDKLGKVLNEHITRDTVIVVDEIPVDGAAFNAFLDAAAATVIAISHLRLPASVRFAFSCLANPEDHLTPQHRKIAEKVQFYYLGLWPKQDITRLLTFTTKKLGFKFSDIEKQQIISAAGGSPRLLKRILRTRGMFLGDPNWSLTRVIREVIATNV